MELKACPLCGSSPFLLSENEVTCVNGQCPARGQITAKRVWNIRAEVAGRDSQILRELKLEHGIQSSNPPVS